MLGAKGLRAGLAYEACARVALITNDPDGFRAHLRACAQHYLVRKNPALCARYDRIVRDARAAGMRIDASPLCPLNKTSFDMREVELQLRAAATLSARHAALLALVVRHAGARAGALYLDDAGRMLLKATLSESAWPAQLEIGLSRASAVSPKIALLSAEPCSQELLPEDANDRTVEASLGALHTLQTSVFILERAEGGSRVTGVAMLRGPSAAWTQRPIELSATAAGLLLGAASVEALDRAAEQRHNFDLGGECA